LKRTSESHVKRISVRLLFALKRKKNLSETGSPYFRAFAVTNVAGLSAAVDAGVVDGVIADAVIPAVADFIPLKQLTCLPS
jgi:hypothetical protein